MFFIVIFSAFYLRKSVIFLVMDFLVTEKGVVSILFILAIIMVGHDNATKTTKLPAKLHPCDGAKGYLIETHRRSLFVGLNKTACVRTCFDAV